MKKMTEKDRKSVLKTGSHHHHFMIIIGCCCLDVVVSRIITNCCCGYHNNDDGKKPKQRTNKQPSIYSSAKRNIEKYERKQTRKKNENYLTNL